MIFIKTIPAHCSDTLTCLLKKLGLSQPLALMTGEVKLPSVGSIRINKIKNILTENGFTLAADKKEILSEKIKKVVEEMLEQDSMPVVNVSVHIARELGHNYTYLSNLFSELNGITIEYLIISSRVAKAKQLLQETSMNMSEISRLLHYKSIAHFSSQFKKITGLTPSAFRRL